MMLALEKPGSIAFLDDALARRVATAKGIPIKGTLGLLLDAKRAGHLEAVEPSLDRLQSSGFRLAEQTREVVLKACRRILKLNEGFWAVSLIIRNTNSEDNIKIALCLCASVVNARKPHTTDGYQQPNRLSD